MSVWQTMVFAARAGKRGWANPFYSSLVIGLWIVKVSVGDSTIKTGGCLRSVGPRAEICTHRITSVLFFAVFCKIFIHSKETSLIMSTKITRVHARQIIDSRGNPTVEADVTLTSGAARPRRRALRRFHRRARSARTARWRQIALPRQRRAESRRQRQRRNRQGRHGTGRRRPARASTAR